MPLNSSVRESGEIVITSGNRLTIENIDEFIRIVREALQAAKSVSIEFEPDVEIDITGMQAICAACKSAAARGKMFLYNGPQPKCLTDAIAACGAERRAFCKHNNNSICTWFGGAW